MMVGTYTHCYTTRRHKTAQTGWPFGFFFLWSILLPSFAGKFYAKKWEETLDNHSHGEGHRVCFWGMKNIPPYRGCCGAGQRLRNCCCVRCALLFFFTPTSKKRAITYKMVSPSSQRYGTVAGMASLDPRSQQPTDPARKKNGDRNHRAGVYKRGARNCWALNVAHVSKLATTRYGQS